MSHILASWAWNTVENTLVIAFESVKRVNQIVTRFIALLIKMFKMQNILKRNRKCHLFPLVALANTYNLCLMIQSVSGKVTWLDVMYQLFIHLPALGLPQSYLSFTRLSIWLYCTTCKALLKQMSCKNWVLWLFCLFCASCLIWISYLHMLNKPVGA